MAIFFVLVSEIPRLFLSQETENERQRLQEKNDDLQIKLEALQLHDDKLSQLRDIQAEVGNKITEMHHLHEQMVDKLQS